MIATLLRRKIYGRSVVMSRIGEIASKDFRRARLMANAAG
jgi:hypothetical protein